MRTVREKSGLLVIPATCGIIKTVYPFHCHHARTLQTLTGCVRHACLCEAVSLFSETSVCTVELNMYISDYFSERSISYY